MAVPSLIEHVSDTAFMVAHYRAMESQRPDAVFQDPLAGRLAGARGQAIAGSLPSATARMSAWTLAIRTVVIDGFIIQAVADGVDVVANLGAGLDTRPYRLDLPASLQWIEVDYPDMIAFKETGLAGESPRCRLQRIGLDLADVPARRALLRELGGRGRRLLVLTEGVIPYLDADAVGALADDLRAVPSIVAWIVDYLSRDSIAYRKRSGVNRAMKNAPFRFDPGGDWFGFFARHGWRRRAIRYLPVEGARLRRPAPLPLPLRVAMKLLRPLAPAHKRDRFDQFSGYAVMEPAAPSAGFQG